MTEQLVINTTRRLDGKARVAGAKNAALPIIAATLASPTPVTLLEVPDLSDVAVMLALLRHLGAQVAIENTGDSQRVEIDPRSITGNQAPASFTDKMRASTLVLSPLLVRFGQASVAMPGGCQLGPRPLNYHIQALRTLGVQVDDSGEVLACRMTKAPAGKVVLPFPSVGATEQVLVLGLGGREPLTIDNAACEPEVMDLCQFLQKLQAKIHWHDRHSVTITPPERRPPSSVTHRLPPDRLVIGTLIAALAVTGGEVFLSPVSTPAVEQLHAIWPKWGIDYQPDQQGLRLSKPVGQRPQPVAVTTAVWPGFPTDLQAQAMAVACYAQGQSQIHETVFSDRFHHVAMYQRLGADIQAIASDQVTINGKAQLRGADLIASDIRASAGLVIAALAAEGQSTIAPLTYLDRGYQRLDQQLQAMGANCVRRVIA